MLLKFSGGSPQGSLFGTAVTRTVAVGALTLTLALSGAAVTSSTAIAALNETESLSGAAITRTVAVGAMTGAGELSGAAVISTAALGNLQQAGSSIAVSGAAVTQSVTIGDLQGVLGPALVQAAGHGSADIDVFQANQRKTRQILHLKRLRTEQDRISHDLKQVELQILEVRTERVEHEAKTQTLLQDIDSLAAHLEQAKPKKAAKLLEQRFSLERLHVSAQERARSALLKERELERQKVELKKRLQAQEEQEAVEAMMVLMMMDEEDG